MERALLEFDVLRRKAGARVVIGGALPGASASILRMQNAALSKNGKWLLLASVRGSLDFPIVARRMRRLSDPCGAVAAADVLAADVLAATD